MISLHFWMVLRHRPELMCLGLAFPSQEHVTLELVASVCGTSINAMHIICIIRNVCCANGCMYVYTYIYIHIHTHMWIYIYIYNMLMFIFRAVDPQQCMADLHSVSRLWILPGNPPRYAIDDSFVDDTHDDFPMNILVISPSYVKST